jgi:quercetin dioxygenase-like cupin family protein
MEITRNGSQPSRKGPTEYFTGSVRIDPLLQAPEPARVTSASVTFEPGARTAWHTHPLGQIVVVTAPGCRPKASHHQTATRSKVIRELPAMVTGLTTNARRRPALISRPAA